MIPPITAPTISVAASPATEPAPKANAFEAISHELASGSSDGMARSLSNPTTLGTHVATELSGWQAKLEQMDHMISKASTPSQAASPVSLDRMPSSLPGAAPIFGLMVQTFNFAMQTQLVARAATQFTGSINTLMKGQ